MPDTPLDIDTTPSPCALPSEKPPTLTGIPPIFARLPDGRQYWTIDRSISRVAVESLAGWDGISRPRHTLIVSSHTAHVTLDLVDTMTAAEIDSLAAEIYAQLVAWEVVR